MSTARTLALGALILVGVGAVSEAQVSPTPQPRSDTGSYRRGPGPEGQRGRGARKARGGNRGGRDLGMARDLNLTETQRTQIRAIHQKYQPQHQALRERARPFHAAANTARQNWDSAGFRTNMERARQVMQGGQAIHNQQIAEVRAVLTADQRVKFDARQQQMTERRAKAGAKWGEKGSGRKGLRPGGPVTPSVTK